MIIGRWLNRVSLHICSDLEEVFSYPFRLSQNCFDNKKTPRKWTRRGKEPSTGKVIEIMDVLGLLRIRVRRGINLAVRDTLSSDPYCVVSCESQRVKTKVVRGNCNPVWNEELTIYIKHLDDPISLCVYDKDTFTVDDSMGTANIDITGLIKCLLLRRGTYRIALIGGSKVPLLMSRCRYSGKLPIHDRVRRLCEEV